MYFPISVHEWPATHRPCFLLDEGNLCRALQSHAWKEGLIPFRLPLYRHANPGCSQQAGEGVRRGKPYPIFPPGRPPKESSPDVIEIDDDGVTMQWKPPASTGKKAVKEYVVHMKVQDQDFKVIKKMPPPSPEASGTELCTNWINADTFLEDGLAGTQGGWQQSPDGSAHREWRLRLQGRCHMSAVWPGRVGSSKRKVIAVLEEQQRKSAFIILLFSYLKQIARTALHVLPAQSQIKFLLMQHPKTRRVVWP